jgi:hypothetical protein
MPIKILNHKQIHHKEMAARTAQYKQVPYKMIVGNFFDSIEQYANRVGHSSANQ